MPADVAADGDAAVFFTKLLRALEFGKRKAENELVDALFDRFGRPPDDEDPATWLTEHASPEDVMGWLMREIQPFAAMLGELYEWLADVRATVGGNVDEVRFDFAALDEQVSFPLDSFPKSYVRRWTDTTALTERFDPAARGRLRVDTPNYWADDVLAVANLSYATVLRVSAFEQLPAPNQHAVASRVRRVVEALEREYVRHARPADIDAWAFRNHEALYVTSEADWARALELGRRPGSGGGTVTSAAAADLYDHFERGLDSGRMVHGDLLVELLAHAERKGIGDVDPATSDLVFGADLEADDTHAFLCAYDLCFPQSERPLRVYADIVDKVLLPFWRHRWRLFEVWSILWIRNVLPESTRPMPCLEARDDTADTFTWVLAGGDAASPVATRSLRDRELSLWFQLKTPLTGEDAARFRQANIEPDIRLREAAGGVERDLAILELKDRHLAAGSEEKRVARMYATTSAPVVCVANYSPFRPQTLRGVLYRESAGPTTIYLADSFGPGETPDEVANAIRDAVSSEAIHILLDVSMSMNVERVRQVLGALPAEVRSTACWFRWADTFEQVADETSALAEFDGPSTDVQQALDAHRPHADQPALILTDHEGADQFDKLRRAGMVDDQRYRCVDVDEDVDVLRLAGLIGTSG